MSLRYLQFRGFKLPTWSVVLTAALGAHGYSCAPDFDRLTSDNGKAQGGHAGQGGSAGCVDESCGGSGAANGGSHAAAGTDNTSAGNGGHGGAGDGGAGIGGAGIGGAGIGGAGDGGAGDGAGAGGAGAGGAGASGAGDGGAGDGGAGEGGKGGPGGIEPDPELPVLECGGTACPDANVLVDMEANDGKVCTTSGRAGGTFFFNDGTGDQWPPPDPLGVTKFSPLAACRGQSAVALHTKGNSFTSWGAGVVLKFSDHGWDASAFTGVTFWAMSSTRTRIAFGIASMETQDVAYGGACVPKDGLQCADHFTASRSISASWMAYTITFAELRQRGFGVPSPNPTINPAGLTELNITFPTGQPFDVWIDDVVFTQ